MVKGYKVLNPNYTAFNGFRYEVGKKYEMEGPIEVGGKGFHFCRNPADLDGQFILGGKFKCVEVEAYGDVVDYIGISCTNAIKIVREIPWEEFYELANYGKGNTGVKNVGFHNEGDGNIGDENSGYSNVGDYNRGNMNTGDCNVGDGNSGDFNIGDGNSGSYNYGYYHSGVFNTEVYPKIMMFDRPSEWTMVDWFLSAASVIMAQMPEKKIYRQDWWNELSDDGKNTIINMPNFDAEKFEKCTGIDVTGLKE